MNAKAELLYFRTWNLPNLLSEVNTKRKNKKEGKDNNNKTFNFIYQKRTQH